MDESQLFVFKLWRVFVTLCTALMLPGYIDADDVNTWAWVSLGAFVLISGLLWLRRLPPTGMYSLMLLANAANAIGNGQEGNIATAVVCGAIACGCVWWAWGVRDVPSERALMQRLAESGGEG